MTYIFKAIFIVQFKILNPKKAQLTSKQNIKYSLHVNSYMIANSVEEQMVVSLLILPHRVVEIVFRQQRQKKGAYVWKVTYRMSCNCVNT